MFRVARNDTLLIASLGYLILDLSFEWQAFSRCPRPIHKWLVGTYLFVIAWRVLSNVAASRSSTEVGAVSLNLRHKDPTSRIVVGLMWFGLPPLLLFWSILGSVWTWEVMTLAPERMPGGLHFGFLFIWQFLGYVWLVVQSIVNSTAWTLERRVRQAEHDLRQIQDADVVSRWGNVGSLDGYSSLPATMAGGGMPPAQIRILPGVRRRAMGEVDEDCPICLNGLQADETVRKLEACGHEFHRSCIDLWLLRSMDCPMCKTKVAPGSV